MGHIVNYVMLKTIRAKKVFLATSFLPTVPKYSLSVSQVMNPCERRETTWYSTKVADLQFGGFVHDIVAMT